MNAEVEDVGKAITAKMDDGLYTLYKNGKIATQSLFTIDNDRKCYYTAKPPYLRVPLEAPGRPNEA